MPLIIPTQTLDKLKKFPSQVFISILLILLGYFINVAIRSKDDTSIDWKNRAVTSERKNDSIMKAFSDFRDALIAKNEGLEYYRQGAKKVDSLAHEVIKPKAKRIIKSK